jgi:hypothetical protein
MTRHHKLKGLKLRRAASGISTWWDNKTTVATYRTAQIKKFVGTDYIDR